MYIDVYDVFLIIYYSNWNNKKSLVQYTFNSVKTNSKIIYFLKINENFRQ